MKEGMEGVGIYWCIIEMLYEQNGSIPLSNIEGIAFELHLDCERIKNVLQKYDLFKFKDEIFYSESVMRRLKVRNKKSLGARTSALKRWYPNKYNDANAMRTQSESNAIKERKGKERKEEKNTYIEDSDLNFIFLKFLEMRKKIRKPASDYAIKLLIGKLNKLSSDKSTQTAIIEQSIVKGWQDLFPLNNSHIIKTNNYELKDSDFSKG